MNADEPIRPVSVVPGDNRKIETKPTRRSYSWEYKKAILEEIEASRSERGSIGRILRREGLYPAQVANWREEAEARASGDFQPRKRGRKPDPHRDYKLELARLQKENDKLRKELEISQALVELQKKVAALMANDDEP